MPYSRYRWWDGTIASPGTCVNPLIRRPKKHRVLNGFDASHSGGWMGLLDGKDLALARIVSMDRCASTTRTKRWSMGPCDVRAVCEMCPPDR